MSLSTLITNSIKNTVSDDQGLWRQFILDHLDYIAARSRPFNVDAEVANLYRYDLSRFLSVKLMRHQDIAWIVLLLNSMSNDFAFDGPMTILVPTDDLIVRLYHSYISINANAQ